MDKKKKQRRKPPEMGSRVKKEKPAHYKPRKNPTPAPEPERSAPEVVYLAPKPFSRSRLLLHLATVLAVVLAVTLGLSVFFKVENIEISGCNQYTAWQVQQASGVQTGDQLLTFNRARAAGQIISQLPYVKNVRIDITLPGTVKIQIVETQVTYAVETKEGIWWLMDCEGKLIEAMPQGTKDDHTLITGVQIINPKAGEKAIAWQDGTTQTDGEGNTVPVTVTAAQRLSTAVEILGLLEHYGIIGNAASLDVENTFEMELWYEDRFQVVLGDTTNLGDKIRKLKAFVDDYTLNRPYEKGLLDLSDPEWIEYESFGETA